MDINQEKLHILILPDIYPESNDDYRAIFFKDVVYSIKPFCKVTVLYVRMCDNNKGPWFEKDDDLTIIRCNIKKGNLYLISKLRYLLWYFKVYTLGIKNEGIDIVHSLSFGSVLCGTVGWLISRKIKSKFILTENYGPFSEYLQNPLYRIWSRYIMGKTDICLAVSKHLANEIYEGRIYLPKLEVIYNPVDTLMFDLPETRISRRNMLFIGRLDQNKGALRALKAFHLIANEYPEWTITIIGSGNDEKHIKEYLDKNIELKDKVNLKGMQPKRFLPKYMKETDFFVYPTLFESFGIVLAEAMASGLPVITTNQTGPNEFVDIESGILIDPMDINAISVAIKTMILKHQNYDPVKIRSKIVERFSFYNYGGKLYNIYKKII